eukprot:1138475-Pelagomonas_calceolata.AAC.4
MPFYPVNHPVPALAYQSAIHASPSCKFKPPFIPFLVPVLAYAAGDHGSTFAGNPMVCNAACAVFDIISQPSFLASVEAKGERLRAGLRKISNPHVKEVRGVGLLCGMQLDVPAGPVVNAAREMGVLAITAGSGDVVRLVPPLVVSDAEIDKCVEVLGKAVAQLQ